jgi:hypothetical protein
VNQPAARRFNGGLAFVAPFSSGGRSRFSKKSAFGDGGDARVPESKRKQSACFISGAFRIDPHWEATINDPEYYTESWTVLMKIAWVDGQQISEDTARKTTAIGRARHRALAEDPLCR